MSLKLVGFGAALLALTLVSAPVVHATTPRQALSTEASGVVVRTFLLINGTFVDVSEVTDYDDGHVYVNATLVGTLGNDGKIYDSANNPIGYITIEL